MAATAEDEAIIRKRYLTQTVLGTANAVPPFKKLVKRWVPAVLQFPHSDVRILSCVLTYCCLPHYTAQPRTSISQAALHATLWSCIADRGLLPWPLPLPLVQVPTVLHGPAGRRRRGGRAPAPRAAGRPLCHPGGETCIGSERSCRRLQLPSRVCHLSHSQARPLRAT